MSRFAIFIDDANQGGSFPNSEAAEAAAKGMGLRPGQFEVKPKSASPVGPPKSATHDEVAAHFAAEWTQREKTVKRAIDDVRERASADVTKANAAAGELAKKLAAADQELAAFRAAAASTTTEADPKNSEPPAQTETKSDPKKK